jgi:hypothetical protein
VNIPFDNTFIVSLSQQFSCFTNPKVHCNLDIVVIHTVRVFAKVLVFEAVGVGDMVEWGEQEYEGVVANKGTKMG